METLCTPKKRKKDFDNNLNTRSPKRSRKELTLKLKYDLITEYEKTPKPTQKDLALQFGIGKTTVSDILKRSGEYKTIYEDNTTSARNRHDTGSKYGELNDLVFQWFKQARAKNIPLSGPIIQEKALELAETLDLTDFKASNGCADVDQSVVDDFKSKLENIVGDYTPENVFNADETGLFFKALPDKTLGQKGEACKGGKLAKERITVMLACSSTGEKLPPLVIGKAKKPRCFKNINVNNLPVIWQSSKKAWMTTYIFTEWIQQINKKMKSKKRKILLFLDNATSHSDSVTLSNVTIKFFPPNTTSKLQPLDLGIIRAFKARYRKHMLKHVITKIDNCTDNTSLTKEINVLDAVHWIDKSWSDTKESTIASCFRNAGFPL
ncbi:unnamed protein product [Mytilus edulis]|uniref:HTH CENPB-type domain-containing protein n=1 Tax=Mytilus edulis TaxID=6550 RepID=A0A8S3V029_MYTED|nr:unnamed protein product [Mytilus edulis]